MEVFLGTFVFKILPIHKFVPSRLFFIPPFSAVVIPLSVLRREQPIRAQQNQRNLVYMEASGPSSGNVIYDAPGASNRNF